VSSSILFQGAPVLTFTYSWSLKFGGKLKIPQIQESSITTTRPGSRKNMVEESKNSMIPQEITFEATGETTWEVPAEFAEVRH